MNIEYKEHYNGLQKKYYDDDTKNKKNKKI